MPYRVFVQLVLSLPILFAASAALAKDAKAIQGTWLPTAADQGTVKLDPSAKPKAMDITGTDGPNKGKTFLAIYELNGDTLRICYDLSGKSRPTEFKTVADTQLYLVTYKREGR